MTKEKRVLKPDADGFLYGLEDKVPAGQCTIYGIQYLVYFLAGSAIMPVIIGAYLGLEQAEIAQMLQRTFLLSGGISILQAVLGHRFPIIDGPAGLWMGLLIILAGSATAFGKDLAVLRIFLMLDGLQQQIGAAQLDAVAGAQQAYVVIQLTKIHCQPSCIPKMEIRKTELE